MSAVADFIAPRTGGGVSVCITARLNCAGNYEVTFGTGDETLFKIVDKYTFWFYNRAHPEFSHIRFLEFTEDVWICATPYYHVSCVLELTRTIFSWKSYNVATRSLTNVFPHELCRLVNADMIPLDFVEPYLGALVIDDLSEKPVMLREVLERK